MGKTLKFLAINYDIVLIAIVRGNTSTILKFVEPIEKIK